MSQTSSPPTSVRPLVLIDATNALNPRVLGGKLPIEKFREGLMTRFPQAVVKFYVQLNATNAGYISVVRRQGFEVITDIRNLDIKIAIDGVMLLQNGHFNPLIIASMDGDFIPLVNFAKSLGVKVYVIAHECSMLSYDLQMAADYFIDIIKLFKDHGDERELETMDKEEACVSA